MMNELISHIATTNGIEENAARKALGIVLNAAERQSSPLAVTMFKTLPGARALAARTGSEIGAATGPIARLIEQTPGGKRHVGQQMIRDLHTEGFGHKEVGELLPSIAGFMETKCGLSGFGHLGDLIGDDLDAEHAEAAAA